MRAMKLFSGAVATLSLAVFAAPAQAAAVEVAEPQAQSATFYEHAGYCCSSLFLSADAGGCVNLPAHWKNTISSFRHGGARIALYDNDNCDWLIGAYVEDMSTLPPGVNDRANSVKVIQR